VWKEHQCTAAVSVVNTEDGIQWRVRVGWIDSRWSTYTECYRSDDDIHGGPSLRPLLEQVLAYTFTLPAVAGVTVENESGSTPVMTSDG
jgi:hypothetical protein